MTDTNFSNNLMNMLANKGQLKFTANEENAAIGDLTIKLENISQQRFDEILAGLTDIAKNQRALQQAPKDLGDSEFSGYFQQVIDCPMYKPKNPRLALFQVAKTNGLEISELQVAFRKYMSGGK